MENIEKKQTSQPQRLCSEIQLFDLCDLDSCSCSLIESGRFCSNEVLVSNFEKIAGEELAPPQLYIDEEEDYMDDETEEEDIYDLYDDELDQMDDERNLY